MSTGPGFPIERPRRFRRSAALRRLVAETRLHPAELVLPMFVKEDITAPVPVPSMPGVVQHTQDSLRKAAHEAVEAGVGGIILFGIPSAKDGRGSGADDPEGVVQVALRQLRSEFGDTAVLIADLCLDEYTDHGHCGILVPEPARHGAGGSAASGGSGGGADAAGERYTVDNDATLERYADIALAQASAGADVVAPSGMMDGQVGAIRSALDQGGFPEVPILAYSAKYASSMYGPFRDAAECAPKFGDRAGYQQDPGNVAEALREVRLDLQEGADAVMVKPALAYLDVISAVRAQVEVPVAAYQVSGEYAMIEAAAANGWIDRERAIMESLTSIRRAGADMILTYWATEVARHL